MENLNAEQIKKALSVCWDTTCSDCEFDSNCGGHWQVLENAVALINSQEQKIKELTEENEAWQKQLISTKEQADKAYYELACDVEDLRAENERLRAEIEDLKSELEKRPPKLVITKI